MRATLRLLVLLTILHFIYGSPTVLPGSLGKGTTTFDITGRIVNGTKAVLRQFPYQVSLKRSWNNKHFCGGSIISSSLVLTAGHCVYISGKLTEPWMVIVVGGIVHLVDEVPSRQERKVLDIRIHPEFDISTLHNDVAVIQLSEPFTFTPELNNVPLSANAPVPKTVCQVAGWGYHSANYPIVFPDLMYVDLPIRSTKECRKLLINETDLPPGMYCAGYIEGGRDACQGDSGGGMICDGILTGVVSGGKGCAQPRLPGVYADISHYLNWILSDSDVIIVVQKVGNSGVVNTSESMMMLISFLFCALINYT
ncbi:trypsin [Monomorium pharaonis]|uniref:trypsin n=1 Tax=Monomorium pharaonis TaxID=307658 RepID=UPI0017471BE2|nr:trypsin [Monomorium pharaonis]